jgi:hypothetical protein
MFLGKKILLIALCFLTVLVAAFVTSLTKSYFFSRFDYDSIRKDEKISWKGPEEGEKIKLSGFKNERSAPIPQLPNKTLILLSLVDPKCGMCKRSADLIEHVRNEAESHQVKFFLISVTPEVSNEEFLEYAKTFGDSVEIFSWRNEDGSLLPSLQKMVVPSFILVDENGVVLRRFPGSSNEITIRDQMGTQIINETLSEKAKL